MKVKLFLIIVIWLFNSFQLNGQNINYPSSCYSSFVDDGAWCWFSDPRAVHYKGKYDKTYVASVSSKGDINISAYDHNTKNITTHNVAPGFQHDDHTVPSLLFLPDRRLMIFFTRHNGGFYYTTTTNPEDITSWEKVTKIDMGKMQCYSNPVMLKEEKNHIYVFFRGGYNWKPSFVVSDDLGKTWSEPITIVAKPGMDKYNRPYTKVISDGNKRIWFAITDGHPRVEPLNSIYVFFYEADKFYQVDGTEIGTMKSLPLNQNIVLKAYDGVETKVRSWIWDIALDEKGNPVIVYTMLNEETNHKYYYGKWTGTEWENHFISNAGRDFPRKDYKKEDRNPEPHYSGGIIWIIRTQI